MSTLVADVVVFVHLAVKVLKNKSQPRGCHLLIERDTPHPSHLFSGEAVHRLLGQDAVDLAQPFPVYTNTIVRLLFGCTVDPINLGFKVVMLAFQKVRIGIDTNMLTIPDNTPLAVRTVTPRCRQRWQP